MVCWYFHFPNYALALLFLDADQPLHVLADPAAGVAQLHLPLVPPQITDWLMRPVAFVTPSIVPRLVLRVAAFWVAMARVAFFMGMYAAGLQRRVPVPGRAGAMLDRQT